MALDEPRDNDETFAIDGFTFLVDKGFLEKVQPVHVDWTGLGFKLDCAIQFGGGCAGCGSTGTCG